MEKYLLPICDEEVEDEFQVDSTDFFNELIAKFQTWFYGIICMTLKTYDRIMVGCEHPGDCIAVYVHLLRTARWQKTESVKAKNVYIQNGLGFGEARVKRAKAELHKIGLIEYVQRHRKEEYEGDPLKGKYEGLYIKVKYIPSFQGITKVRDGGLKNTPAFKHTSVYEGQMLKENKEMLKENKQTNPECCSLFLKTFNKKIPENILKKNNSVDIEKVVQYMVGRESDPDVSEIENPVAYLVVLLKNPETIPESEESDIPHDKPLTEDEKKVISRLNRLWELEKRYERCQEVREKIKKMIEDVEQGITDDKFEREKGELDELIRAWHEVRKKEGEAAARAEEEREPERIKRNDKPVDQGRNITEYVDSRGRLVKDLSYEKQRQQKLYVGYLQEQGKNATG